MSPNDKFWTILSCNKSADNNFRHAKSPEKLIDMIENTENKGEIAQYEQILHFSQCFHNSMAHSLIIRMNNLCL